MRSIVVVGVAALVVGILIGAALPGAEPTTVVEDHSDRMQRLITRSLESQRGMDASSQPAESMARAYLSRVQGGIDSPMGDILPQMPDGMIPERRQSGANRTFTYTFGDDSQMILTFRPQEVGQGLALYTTSVAD